MPPLSLPTLGQSTSWARAGPAPRTRRMRIAVGRMNTSGAGAELDLGPGAEPPVLELEAESRGMEPARRVVRLIAGAGLARVAEDGGHQDRPAGVPGVASTARMDEGRAPGRLVDGHGVAVAEESAVPGRRASRVWGRSSNLHRIGS